MDDATGTPGAATAEAAESTGPADYTVQALVEYKLGVRTNNVMQLMTSRLADAEIAALAAYFEDIETD